MAGRRVVVAEKEQGRWFVRVYRGFDGENKAFGGGVGGDVGVGVVGHPYTRDVLSSLSLAFLIFLPFFLAVGFSSMVAVLLHCYFFRTLSPMQEFGLNIWNY